MRARATRVTGLGLVLLVVASLLISVPAVAESQPATDDPSLVAPAMPQPPVGDEPALPAAPARRLPWLWVGAGALALILVVGALALLSGGEEEVPTTPTEVAQVEATEAPAQVGATEAPAQVEATEEPPPGGAAPRPQPVEAALPPDLLTPPQQGQILSICEDDPQQICIYNVDPFRLIDKIPVNMEVGWPIWSPAGDQILFHAPGKGGLTDLWLVNRDGSDLRVLTDVPDVNEEMAAWSPDGEWIAFHRNGGLYLIRPNGQQLREIPLPQELQGCVFAPAWSPDGRELAFLQDDHGCGGKEDGKPTKMRLVAVERDGSHARPLVGWETSNPGDIQVAWSFDGQFVAYQPEAGEDWLLVRSDGSGKVLTIGQAPEWWFPNFWPPWGKPQSPVVRAGPPSPGEPPSVEGTVVEECETAKGQICLRDSGDQVHVVPVDRRFWFRSPSWSPDGGWIVVSASDQGDPYEDYDLAPGHLYILDTACFDQPNACSDSLHQLTSGESNDVQPAWSPDGQWIAFHRDGDLALVRPDPSSPETVPFNFDTDERCTLEPAWSPDSRQIAFFNVVGGCEQEPPFEVEVRVIGVGGEDDRALWREQVDNWPWAVAWSPDGQAVAVAVTIEGRDRWLLIPLDGGPASEMNYEPVWWLPQYWPPWGGQAAAGPSGAAPTPSFEVTVEGEHSPVIPPEEAEFKLDDGSLWQADSDDPAAVFWGKAVAFRGLDEGGVNPVIRYRVTFEREVALTGVTIEFVGASNTYFRLYDPGRNEVAVVGPFYHGNVIRQERLNVGTIHGREFFLQIENEICCWFGIQNIAFEVATAPSPAAQPPPQMEWKMYDSFEGDRLDTDRRWFAPRSDFPLEIEVSDSSLKVRAENSTDGFIGYPLVSRGDAPVLGIEATVGLEATSGEEGSFVGVTLLGEGQEFWLLGLTGPNGDVLLHHGQGDESLSTRLVAHTGCCPTEHNLRLRVEGDRLLAELDGELVADEPLQMEPRRFGLSLGLPPGATLAAYINDVSIAAPPPLERP